MNKKTISVFEISILVIASIAFAYLISDRTNIVSAQEEEITGCCEKTKTEGICFDVAEDECLEGFAPGAKCVDYANCKLGCCVNKENGQCNVRTPKLLCEDVGRWIDKEECQVPECLRGCCVIGTQTQFITERSCKIISDFYEIQKDFRNQITTEIECLDLSYATEEGACVYEQADEKECKFITQQECKKIQGATFERGKFCSDALPGKCIGKDSKKCVDGKDPIYWFDSCGNKESIAEKCDRFAGTTCGYTNAGNAYCKDLDCHNIPENLNGGRSERKNGESWCVYEGDTKHAVPGSSHYRMYCLDGDVEIEPCYDARAKICVESRDNPEMTYARCVSNPATNCLVISAQRARGEISDSTLTSRCNAIPFCQKKHYNFGSELSFDYCLPKYPRGFALPDEISSAGNICTIGSFTKKRYEQERWKSAIDIDWKCLGGCYPGVDTWGEDEWEDDYKAFFRDVQKNLCERVADCGADVNLIGEVSTKGTSLRVRYEEEDGDRKTKHPGIASMYRFADYSNYIKRNINDYIPVPDLTGLGDSAAWPAGSSVDMDADIEESFWTYTFPDWNLWESDWSNFFAGTWSVIEITFSIVIMVVFFVFNVLFGAGTTRDHKFTFTCGAWTAPKGGKNCEKCSEIGVGICTRYKCASLGTSCYFEDVDNDGDGECFWEKVDPFPPLISPLDEAADGVSYSEISETGFRIGKDGGACIGQFDKFSLGITTNARAICTYGFSQDEIGIDFEGERIYNFNHTITNITFSDKDPGDVTFYVKCANRDGYENEAPYLIRSCATETDLTPPQITRTTPENHAYIKYGETSINLSVLLNEPSLCKWSKTDKVYDSMENEFLCDNRSIMNDIEWACQTNLTGLIGNETPIFIRCKDLSNNKNTQSYLAQEGGFVVYESASPLQVQVTYPEEESEVIFGRIIEFELKAETSGGANSNAICSYSFTKGNLTIPFFETGGSVHTQKFTSVREGQHTVYIECFDEALNRAETEVSFTVTKDKYPPTVARTYKQDSNLYVETNEDSVCVYSFDNCNFVFEDGIEMAGIGKEHQAPWKVGKTYYIKCRDLWDNVPDGCTIELKTT